MRRISSISALAVTVSFAGHLGAILFAQLRYPDYRPYEIFGAIFLVFALSSFGLSIAMFAVERRRDFYILVVVRIIFVLFLCGMYGSIVSIAFYFVIPFVVEVAAYESYPANLIIDLLVVSVAVTTKAVTSPDAAAILPDLTTFLFGSAVLSSFACLQTRRRQEMIELAAEIVRLDKAVVDLSDASKGYLREAHIAEERTMRLERERISRELHDTVGYTLTNLIMMLEAAKALVDVDGTKLTRVLEEANAQAQQGMTETRRSLHLLRKQEVRGPVGLPSIERMVRTFESATGVAVDSEYGNVPLSCGEEIDAFLFHFVQEGLTNSFRHGKATMIKLRFWAIGDVVHVTIRDNGKGAEQISEGIGMMGMRERLGNLGGTLEIRNAADGFELSAEVPTMV